MVIPFQMRHLNNNVLAAITIETTGPQAGHHDIVRLCVMLLDNFIEPANHVPFYMDIQPRRKEHIHEKYKGVTISKERLLEIINDSGIDPFTVADRFDEWHADLKLLFRKQIVPLVYDWPYIKSFLVDLMGWEHVKQYFAPQYRDLLSLAVMLNDRTNMRGEPAPYPKQPLAYLASQLKVEHERKEECIQRAYTISKIYKAMLMQWPL